MPSSPTRKFAEISTPTPPTRTDVIMRRAVVLGGSMAGLLAARVLSDHADEVLVIERDGGAADGGPRSGVPQGGHVHALLAAGNVQLDRWFPGFTEAAVAEGAVLPPRGGVKFHSNGELRIGPPSKHDPALLSTRPFLEGLVRARTGAVPNVKFVTGRAQGLVFDDDRVVGARYVPEGATEEVVAPADLVVDGMGRSSRLGDWLGDNGWQRPPMRRMPIKLNYATAVFKRDDAVSDTWVSVSTADSVPEEGRVARIAGINRVEGDRWTMLISGYDDDRPTRDVEDYRTRCRRDFPPVYGDIAERCEMIGDVITYHQADSRRRDYHLVDRLPGGVVATGDAVASFNPVYGQGMTSAALHASCLSAYLRSNPDLGAPAKTYFDDVRVVVDAAWQVSTLADLSLPHVDGPYPRGYPVIKWIGGLVFKASSTDPVVAERMNDVTAMLAPPAVLARPSTLLRAIVVGLRRKVSARRSGA
ncbi:FAD-dependent oxidoreductase [Umezawaea endophytica]|uniref:FAD-binding monooxygenase n=1 Tax=Umezawaea endophytica TaxID=1654476 RepID=A0A9X2VS89_9PSEU|nr:FAD-binding monooxygenase [Umezawaea endophytica]MCS7481267.1 FAD-binding monooxygenase [Umezawaea endophytica]